MVICSHQPVALFAIVLLNFHLKEWLRPLSSFALCLELPLCRCTLPFFFLFDNKTSESDYCFFAISAPPPEPTQTVSKGCIARFNSYPREFLDPLILFVLCLEPLVCFCFPPCFFLFDETTNLNNPLAQSFPL